VHICLRLQQRTYLKSRAVIVLLYIVALHSTICIRHCFSSLFITILELYYLLILRLRTFLATFLVFFYHIMCILFSIICVYYYLLFCLTSLYFIPLLMCFLLLIDMSARYGICTVFFLLTTLTYDVY